MKEVRHLIITGRVQGVWFRASMAQEAERLGVTGWVKNRSDGSVEAMVAGTSEQVAAIMNWARRGPPAAQVEHVAVEIGSGEFSGFEQRR
ncbi:MAG: acylphosphatase [Gammaproteobacteria bacterium]|nr:acylphosphatase [Rhodocyclaceae bacterium]MBU3909474.1 acylphosphatase [Gammaproteobacteria bacterium]MBU3989124.1 acylphosphatase [Gammaproteobacteria bacterium]MBU4003729.1 acylphosphatase [Gammaproteobacteria bacterium]MBU4022186.1 acylphosphatase [Gammaproteobacteria bacterium]